MNRSFIIIVIALVTIHVQAMAQSGDTPIRISLQDKPWVLQLAAPGLVVTQNVVQADGRRYLYATDDSTGVVLSVTLERVKGAATLDGCRKVFSGRIQPGGPFKLAGVKQSQIGETAVLEYMIPVANGAPVEQKNVFGCLAKEDVYVDIHVSKVAFKETDHPRLMAVLSSADFASAGTSEIANTLPTGSVALLGEGSKYFLVQAYDKAIGPYREALELEKKERRLDSSKWRALIDNLAMAYGITGDSTASEEVLKYGLSKDPTYPMFYFLTADLYAERGNLNATLENLRLALMYKGNVIPGENLPDPRKDDSFKRFWKNDEFKKLAAQFK